MNDEYRLQTQEPYGLDSHPPSHNTLRLTPPGFEQQHPSGELTQLRKDIMEDQADVAERLTRVVVYLQEEERQTSLVRQALHASEARVEALTAERIRLQLRVDRFSEAPDLVAKVPVVLEILFEKIMAGNRRSPSYLYHSELIDNLKGILATDLEEAKSRLRDEKGFWLSGARRQSLARLLADLRLRVPWSVFVGELDEDDQETLDGAARALLKAYPDALELWEEGVGQVEEPS